MIRSNDTLQIWKIPLIISEAELKGLFGILSEEEQKNAMRFKFDKHRRRYIVSHAAMRKILSDQLNIGVHELSIHLNQDGKPYISKNPLYFNLSHSEEMALFVLSYQGEVGIDVEYVNRDIDIIGIAGRFFHPMEFDQLKNTSAENRVKYFYSCWTAKEAFLKAKGVGIADHLKMFALDVQHFKNPKVILTNDELEQFSHWFIHAFEPVDDYLATVVSSATPEALVILEYSLK